MDKLLPSTKQDLEILIMFTRELYDVYTRLKELEIAKESDTPEYNKGLERVNQLLDLMETIENRISFNKDELMKVIEYLDDELGIPYDSNRIKFLKAFGHHREKLVLIRIVNNLSKQFDKHIIREKQDSIIRYQIFYNFNVNNNIDLMVLAKIKRNGLFEDETLGRYLTNIKYEMIFVNSDLEQSLCKTGFQVEETPYILRDGLDRLMGMSKDASEECEAHTMSKIISGNLRLLCNSDEKLCFDKDNMARNLVFSYSILAAILLTENQELVTGSLMAIEEVLKRIENTSTFVLVKNLLTDIIEDYEEDKGKYQFVSFGGR